MIKRYIEAYKFDKVKFDTAENYSYSEKGFVIKIRLKNVPTENTVLFEVPGCIKVTERVLKAEEAETMTPYEKSEGYFQKTDENGCAPVIEAEINMFSENHPDWKLMKLGINTLMYDICVKDLYIVYDTVNFRLVYDGEVVNNNMPFGTLVKPEKDGAYLCGELVAEFGCSTDIDSAEFYRTFETVDKKLNFYTPHGHNVFIGDVVNFYHDGVYHMLYMPDRHHHKNRWGGGGHRFEHMITRDFIDWEDVGPIWDVTEQWQSLGTGTMFWHKGKYYVAFGLHTSRTLPDEKLCNRELNEYAAENDETKVVTYAELAEDGRYPSGANYAVSDDGINFTRGDKIFSACENPSIYSENGVLSMYAGYGGGSVWHSDEVYTPWKKDPELKLVCGETAPMRNSDECPSVFEWNGYKYMIMGVTGFWRTEKDSDEYMETGSKGYDIYEGLSVPMAAKTDDNRVILAGWIGGMGWGSMVVHRELIQYEDGNLGMKWMPELFPELHETEACKVCGNKAELEKYRSYYAEAEVDPSLGDVFTLTLSDDEGKACELKINIGERTAQYGSCAEGETAENILPMYKAIKTVEQKYVGFNIAPDTVPHKCGDFSVAHVRYPKESFKVKMLIYYFDKNCGTVIDTEIAGTRTLITNRTGFLPTKITADDKMTDFKLLEAEL